MRNTYIATCLGVERTLTSREYNRIAILKLFWHMHGLKFGHESILTSVVHYLFFKPLDVKDRVGPTYSRVNISDLYQQDRPLLRSIAWKTPCVGLGERLMWTCACRASSGILRDLNITRSEALSVRRVTPIIIIGITQTVSTIYTQ